MRADRRSGSKRLPPGRFGMPRRRVTGTCPDRGEPRHERCVVAASAQICKSVRREIYPGPSRQIYFSLSLSLSFFSSSFFLLLLSSFFFLSLLLLFCTCRLEAKVQPAWNRLFHAERPRAQESRTHKPYSGIFRCLHPPAARCPNATASKRTAMLGAARLIRRKRT